MIALLVIDMINAFVEDKSPLCVKNAKDTVPRIELVVEICRKKGIPLFFIGREYREDGTDVEVTRWNYWSDHNRPLTKSSASETSSSFYGPLKPQKQDYVIIKKKWSAFFRTELDLVLRRLNVDTVVITGTQTPNCIRATAFDSDMNDFETIILSDCVSSNSEEIQNANLIDLQNVGFLVLDSTKFVKKLDELLSRKSRIQLIKDDVEKHRYL